MKEKLYQSLIELTNGKWCSYLLKTIALSKISKNLIPQYTKLYEIDLNEVSNEVGSFNSLHDFFVRNLKEEARPINYNETIFISPVDAKIESFGEIEHDAVFQVKNKPYSLRDLLGKDEIIQKYKNGKYIVFYLSPANYHRIHSPLDAHVVSQFVLGNKSYPVNQLGLKYGKKPISHNYRMVSELKYKENKYFSLIKVGAMFVNSIELTNTSTAWKKGEEIGYFSFGSTVVMLFENATIEFTDIVQRGYSVKMGEPIAIMV